MLFYRHSLLPNIVTALLFHFQRATMYRTSLVMNNQLCGKIDRNSIVNSQTKQENVYRLSIEKKYSNDIYLVYTNQEKNWEKKKAVVRHENRTLFGNIGKSIFIVIDLRVFLSLSMFPSTVDFIECYTKDKENWTPIHCCKIFRATMRSCLSFLVSHVLGFSVPRRVVNISKYEKKIVSLLTI